MLSLIHLVQSPDTWLTLLTGIIVGLIGVIFSSITKRVSKVEDCIEDLTPTVALINHNVQHIKKHCSHCMDEE
jgi:hypothetical protein